MTLYALTLKLGAVKARVIINADDFGLCASVNRAIAQAHRNGVLTSATIMANMPAVDEAIKMAADMPHLGTGVHLNLTEGKPLADPSSLRPIINDKGQFAFSAAKLAFNSILKRPVRTAIEIEFAAQVEYLLDNGIKPTHIDSHKHLHCFPAIYPIVVALAQKFEIPAIRWTYEPRWVRTCLWPQPPKGGKMNARIVSTMAAINRMQDKRYIRNKRFFGLTHTGKIDVDYWKAFAACPFDGIVEVMTHPGYTEGLDPEKTRLIEQRKTELDALCDDQTRIALSDANIERVNYGNI